MIIELQINKEQFLNHYQGVEGIESLVLAFMRAQVAVKRLGYSGAEVARDLGRIGSCVTRIVAESCWRS